jgi:hypothetical protein
LAQSRHSQVADRQIDVVISQGQGIVDAICQIGVSEIASCSLRSNRVLMQIVVAYWALR